MVLAKERLHHQEGEINHHHTTSEKSYVNQTRECIVEMNEQLMRLVEAHDFDFVKVAGSFQKFIVFLKSVYEKELVNIEPQIFTPDICRARYASLDWGKWNYVGGETTSPSNYEETKRKQAENLRSKYKQMHKEVNRILPSIEDQDSDDENIFSSGLPPPSEFEKQFFSTDVDFWSIHSSNNQARSDKTKNIEDLEKEWAAVGEFVSSPQKPPQKKAAPTMEIDVYKKLAEHDLDTKEIAFEQKVEIKNKTKTEKNSKPNSKEPQEPVVDKRAKSRMSRMQIIEHDSD